MRGMSFTERLAKAIEASGVTQRQLATHLGISEAAVSQLVSGRSKQMAAENAARTARLCGVSTYWLSTGVGPMRPAGSSPIAAKLAEDFDRLVPQGLRERVYAQCAGIIEIASSVDHVAASPPPQPPRP